ncbi:MAG: hypothetical protein K0R72_967 [Clostridia bacterium]|jgi:hypothetical protein|nr:hypothetical protein [Clostridia bacterium]
MKKMNFIKKVISLLCVLTVLVMTLPIGTYVSALSGVYLNISAPSNYNPNAGGTITFTLTYSGDVGNIWLGTGSVVLNGFTANKAISGSGNTRTLTLSNLQGAGSGKYVSITGGTAISSTGDLSASANSVSSGTFTINAAAPSDTTKPTLTITAPSPSSIQAGNTVTFVAKYSDNVGIANNWLSAGSIVLNGFTANKSITVSGNDRIITLTNVQGAVGNKSISITGGTASDAAGNLSNAATSAQFALVQNQVAGDTVAPVLNITGPNYTSIYAGQSVTFVARYTDNVGIVNNWLGANSIILNGFTANKSITVSGNDRIITLTNIQGALGNKSISITGGTAVDAAGNLANAATSAQFTIVKQNTTNPPVDKPADWIPNPNTGK